MVLSQNVLTACIWLNGHSSPVLGLLTILHPLLRLSGGSLFMDWARVVTSLWSEFDCWVHRLQSRTWLSDWACIVAVRWHCILTWTSGWKLTWKPLAPKFARLLAAVTCVVCVVFGCSVPLYAWPQWYHRKGVGQDFRDPAEYVGMERMVRPLKMAALLLSIHPCWTRLCFFQVTIQSS